jgi:hypothetical protein
MERVMMAVSRDPPEEEKEHEGGSAEPIRPPRTRLSRDSSTTLPWLKSISVYIEARRGSRCRRSNS